MDKVNTQRKIRDNIQAKGEVIDKKIQSIFREEWNGIF